MANTCWTTPTTLTWRESDHSSKEFMLFSGEAEAARLVRHGWAGDDADVISRLGSWRVRGEGFWRRRLIVTDSVTGAWIGECGRSWTTTERTIRMRDGRQYVWRQAGWWSEEFELCGPDGSVLLVTRTGNERRVWRNLFRTNGWAEIRTAGPDPATLSLLGGLSWLFLLLYRDEMASAVVVV
jgi:hypothetical protein